MPGQCEQPEVVPARPITVSRQYNWNASSAGSDHLAHKLPNFNWEDEAESMIVHFGTLSFLSYMYTYCLLWFFHV